MTELTPKEQYEKDRAFLSDVVECSMWIAVWLGLGAVIWGINVSESFAQVVAGILVGIAVLTVLAGIIAGIARVTAATIRFVNYRKDMEND